MKSLTLVLTLSFAVISAAQNLSFEVASVKPNPGRGGGPDSALGCHGTDNHNPNTTIPMGRCVIHRQPLRTLIALAYNIPPAMLNTYEGKIISGPDWIRTESFNIDAKAEMPATQKELKLMLQALLAERFKLKVHHEMREMPIYALVTTKNGPKLQAPPKDRDCAGQSRSDHSYELTESNRTGVCRAFIPGDGGIYGISVSMTDLSEFMSNWAGRAITDKTGLDGLYDLKLPRMVSANALAPSINAGGRGGGGAGVQTPFGEAPRGNLDLPTVFTAVDQFGLKLEATKGPVDVLVVDEIQRPTED